MHFFFHLGVLHYGKVDAVPDLCHVATRFFHFNFLPLIPVGSDIVVTGGSDDLKGQRLATALSLKSILVAWFRAFLYIVLLGCLIFGSMMSMEHVNQRQGPSKEQLLIVWAAAAASLVCLWLSYRLTRASYDRALQLAAELGLEPAVVERYLTTSKEDREAAKEAEKEPEGWKRYN